MDAGALGVADAVYVSLLVAVVGLVLGGVTVADVMRARVCPMGEMALSAEKPALSSQSHPTPDPSSTGA